MTLLWWTDNPIALNMEETFIVTGLVVLVLGVALGLVTYWIFKKDNDKSDYEEWGWFK